MMITGEAMAFIFSIPSLPQSIIAAIKRRKRKKPIEGSKENWTCKRAPKPDAITPKIIKMKMREQAFNIFAAIGPNRLFEREKKEKFCSLKHV